MNEQKKISLPEIVIALLVEGLSDFADIIINGIMLAGLALIANPAFLALTAVSLVVGTLMETLGISKDAVVEILSGLAIFVFLPITNFGVKIFLLFAKMFWLKIYKQRIGWLPILIILVGSIVEIIPLVNILPIGSITLIIGIFMINNPKITEMAVDVGMAAATGGASAGASLAKKVAIKAAETAVKEKLAGE